MSVNKLGKNSVSKELHFRKLSSCEKQIALNMEENQTILVKENRKIRKIGQNE